MPIRAYCTICSDFFENTRDVAAIHCGHTFHQDCLLQWFHSAPSRTCPQCRIQVSNRHIINKLFFDLGGEEDTTLDAESLKNEVDRIKASLLTKVSAAQAVWIFATGHGFFCDPYQPKWEEQRSPELPTGRDCIYCYLRLSIIPKLCSVGS